MSILFEPININGMTVPNRFVRSATNDRCADDSGRVTDLVVKVYETLAAGGVGLIITGNAYVTRNGRLSFTMLGIDRDDLIPGLKRIAEAVHGYDSKIIVQINHAGRETKSTVIGETPAAPSAVHNPITGETPRALTEEEIEFLIDAFAAAARRVASAGIDGIQMHIAHGYLCNQFLSPHTNRRKDTWGGSLENRMRFVLEVLRRIRKAVGDTYPVMAKLNADDFIDGGLTIEESVQIAKRLTQAGLNAIEISGGVKESSFRSAKADILEEEDEAYFLPYAGKFKAVTDVPLMLVGGLRSPNLMARFLERGDVDMVSLCRPFIREPDLVSKWKQGHWEKAKCISCGGCHKFRDEPVRCILLD